jgi:tetratricopeptide (TPR) repeat protein
MNWKSGFIKNTVCKLSAEQKVVFVTAAGNYSNEVENAKRESSLDGESIVVASHAPNGRSSRFTSFAPEVDITAPSDYHILSYDHDGKLKQFGGTSGATPLVTSTLLSFEIIAGVKLLTPQFKNLLKKTAIRHQNDPPRKVTGAGYLNSYKIGSIALRLVSLCKEFKEKEKKDECMEKYLESEDLYDFSKDIKEDKIMSDIHSAFPQCGEKPTSQNKTVSCDQKKMAINELRKAAFLMPENLNLWKKLSCVHSAEGLSENSKYYAGLARGKRILEKDLSMISSEVSADFIEIMASSEFSKDYSELAFAIIKQNGKALEYASEVLRNNREVVLAAVKQDGLALTHASVSLTNDREIVLQAVKQNGRALRIVSEALTNDREIVLEAVKQNGRALTHVSEALRNDREVVLAAIKGYGLALHYASDTLKNDREIVAEAVKQDGLALHYASEVLKNDRETVLAAIKQNGFALIHASKTLQKDPEIRKAAGK